MRQVIDLQCFYKVPIDCYPAVLINACQYFFLLMVYVARSMLSKQRGTETNFINNFHVKVLAECRGGEK